MLNLLGFNAGPVDGAYGKKTRSALMNFYRDEGSEFDGNLDDNELDDLTSAIQIKSHTLLRTSSRTEQSPKLFGHTHTQAC